MDNKMMVCYTGKNACDIPKDKCSLAMAYVPFQKWEPIYNEEEGFSKGTIFPSLDLPFLGRGVK